ncbi:unnamed protein product [Prorocentrum cordatum]|uniref:Uncharacterized protein n=1 Tax=Prorocentrum cordatum TaxID=2364126 RepID=A0ABN9Y7K1_9DINO|nr:unnamed protein product [Polarella glacialis]
MAEQEVPESKRPAPSKPVADTEAKAPPPTGESPVMGVDEQLVGVVPVPSIEPAYEDELPKDLRGPELVVEQLSSKGSKVSATSSTAQTSGVDKQRAGCKGAALDPFRSLVLELARDAAVEELTDLRDQLPTLAEADAQARRGRIHRALSRLSPGRSTSLAGVVGPAGEVLTAPGAMAAALRTHCAGVFSERPVDQALLEQWVAEGSPPRAPPDSAPQWRLHRRHVEHALKHSPNSAPGPDGIPCAAWRRFGPLAVDVLWAALQDLVSGGEPAGLECFMDTFNASLMQVEARAFGLLVPGSLLWASPADLRQLHRLGFPRGFVDMQSRQLAAKLRVAHLEARASGGLDVRRRAARLRECRRNTDNIVVSAAWADWFDRAFLLQLDNAVEVARGLGVTAARAQDRRVRRQLQRQAAAWIQEAQQGNLEPRVQHKLGRWQVELPLQVRSAHGMHYLQTLGKRVPLRVWAAVWRAMWNGWPTARRTQGREGLPGCVFDCAVDAPDSLEHYADCRCVHEVGMAELGLQPLGTPGARLANFFGLDFGVLDDPDTAKGGLS